MSYLSLTSVTPFYCCTPVKCDARVVGVWKCGVAKINYHKLHSPTVVMSSSCLSPMLKHQRGQLIITASKHVKVVEHIEDAVCCIFLLFLI